VHLAEHVLLVCRTDSSGIGMRWNSQRVSITGTSKVLPLYVTSSAAVSKHSATAHSSARSVA